MGHISHLRKEFKLINTYDYIITLMKRIKLMRIYWFFIWRNLNPYHPRMLAPRLVEIGSVVLEKRIFLNFINVFSLFRNYLPLKKGGDLHLKKLESPSPKDAFGQAWLKLAQWFWRRKFFNFVNVFSLFRNYLPLEMGGGPSFEEN